MAENQQLSTFPSGSSCMIWIFRKKTHRELLEENYKKLLVQSRKLSHVDPKTSNLLATEADDLLEVIMNMKEH